MEYKLTLPTKDGICTHCGGTDIIYEKDDIKICCDCIALPDNNHYLQDMFNTNVMDLNNPRQTTS
jgi:hypothetical protein